jgi:tetratricopeptide (TPR) repeat protein
MSSSRSTNALALLAGFAFLLVAPLAFASDKNDANLKSLYDARRWFELGDAVAKGAADFYEGAVACAFNDPHRCEKKLKSVIKSQPKSDEAFHAHEILASAYLREGKYRAALAQVDALLALRPGDSDAQNTRPLLATLSEFPDQQITKRASTTLQLEENGLPISIHGVRANLLVRYRRESFHLERIGSQALWADGKGGFNENGCQYRPESRPAGCRRLGSCNRFSSSETCRFSGCF